MSLKYTVDDFGTVRYPNPFVVARRRFVRLVGSAAFLFASFWLLGAS